MFNELWICWKINSLLMGFAKGKRDTKEELTLGVNNLPLSFQGGESISSFPRILRGSLLILAFPLKSSARPCGVSCSASGNSWAHIPTYNGALIYNWNSTETLSENLLATHAWNSSSTTPLFVLRRKGLQMKIDFSSPRRVKGGLLALCCIHLQANAFDFALFFLFSIENVIVIYFTITGLLPASHFMEAWTWSFQQWAFCHEEENAISL